MGLYEADSILNILTREIGTDPLGVRVSVDASLDDPGLDEAVDPVFEQGTARDLDETFRDRIRERAEPRSQAAGEQQCFDSFVGHLQDLRALQAI
jgi:hypothetical protein